MPIMITPEGKRSADGQMQAFKVGFLKLAYLAKVPVVPAGVSGTYDVLSKEKLIPRPGPITVRYGCPDTAFLETADRLDAGAIERGHVENIRSLVSGLLVASD